eukprot:UN11662
MQYNLQDATFVLCVSSHCYSITFPIASFVRCFSLCARFIFCFETFHAFPSYLELTLDSGMDVWNQPSDFRLHYVNKICIVPCLMNIGHETYT